VRFLLDSMVYDHLVADPDLHVRILFLQGEQALDLIATHIQLDEITAIVDDDKRIKVASIFPLANVVPTYGFVFGTSARNRARYAEPDQIDAIRIPTSGHTKDSLTAHTARYEAAVLVTDDHRLRNFAIRESIKTWDVPAFVSHVERTYEEAFAP
jgi:hypothetical protein